MSENGSDSIQRHNRQTRKDRIRAQKWFPSPEREPDFLHEAADSAAEADDSAAAPAPFDLDQWPLADEDAQAVQALSSLGDDVVRSLVITPQADRFPALPHQTAAPAPQPAPAAQPVRWPYNLLTAVMLLATGGLLVWFAAIFNAPQSALNPFAPPTPFVILTATPLPQVVDVAASPTPSRTLPAATPLPANALPFVVPDGLLYTANTNSNGCNWSSIAGSVVGLSGEPINSLRVRVIGEALDETVFSGAVPRFGGGGFELPLAEAPHEAGYTVQLFTPEGIALSEPLTVPTSPRCEQNVVILNFVQGRDG